MNSFLKPEDAEFASVIISERYIHKETGAVIIKLNGMKLNFSEADYLKNVLEKELAHNNHNIILDCKAIDMIFSVQIGIIWSHCRKFRDLGGDLILANLQSAISAVLERFGLSKVINVGKSVEDSLQFFK
tara:strand:- start:3927 stop:4316 length:390 start_codon:yes stop_codon:yes gene_type:complete